MSSRTRVLFLSPPATAFVESSDACERHLEVALPRIPFEVLAHIGDGIESMIVDLDWEIDKSPNTPFDELIYTIIRRHEPDVVLTSIYAQSMCDVTTQITTAVKDIDANIPVIVGGQAIAHLQEGIFTLCPDIDIACESALSLSQALKEVRTGDVRKRLLRSPQMLMELPSYSPEFLYRGFPIAEFVDYYNGKGTRVIGYLENQRGCPYRCSFCAAKRPIQERAIEATVAEAIYLLSCGISTFYLIDLTFGVNKSKTEELLNAFESLKMKFPEFRFRCITRVDYLTETLARQLIDSGCYEVGLGIESSSNEVLSKIRKRTSRFDNLQAITNAASAGLAVRLFVILGLPGDDITELYQFLHEVNAVTNEVLLQPSLLRNIGGPHVRTMIESGELHRGIMHQLDFRTDGRRFGLDKDEDIVNYILLSLAWPSTEISRHGDPDLQKRLVTRSDLNFYGGSNGHGGVSRLNNLILIDTGERKLVYVPRGTSIKIRQCLSQCSMDFFEFLVMADGSRDIEQIKNKLLIQIPSAGEVRFGACTFTRFDEIVNSLCAAGLVETS